MSERARGRAGRQGNQHAYARNQHRYRRKSQFGARLRARRKTWRAAFLSNEAPQVLKNIHCESARERAGSTSIQGHKTGIERNPWSERARRHARRQRKQLTAARKQERYRRKPLLGARSRTRGKAKKATHLSKERTKVSMEILSRSAAPGAR